MLVALGRKSSYVKNSIGKRKTLPLACQHLSVKGGWVDIKIHDSIVARGIFNNVSHLVLLREVYLEFKDLFQHLRVSSIIILDAGLGPFSSLE